MTFRTLRHALAVAALLAPIACEASSTSIPANTQDAEALATTGVDAATMVENIGAIVDDLAQKYLDTAAQEVLCVSGEASYTINDVEPAGLSTGDSADIVFSSCVLEVEDVTFTLDGSIHLSAEEITGDTPESFTRQIRASFGAATAVIRGATVIIDGEITTSVSSTDGVTLVVVASGNSLDILAQDSEEGFSGTLSDFDSEATVDMEADTFSVVFEATVDTEELSDSALLATTEPFTGTVGEYPSAGTFVATAASGATVTLVALDNVNVHVLIDADGDGVTGTTIETTWDALDGLP